MTLFYFTYFFRPYFELENLEIFYFVIASELMYTTFVFVNRISILVRLVKEYEKKKTKLHVALKMSPRVQNNFGKQNFFFLCLIKSLAIITISNKCSYNEKKEQWLFIHFIFIIWSWKIFICGGGIINTRFKYVL